MTPTTNQPPIRTHIKKNQTRLAGPSGQVWPGTMTFMPHKDDTRVIGRTIVATALKRFITFRANCQQGGHGLPAAVQGSEHTSFTWLALSVMRSEIMAKFVALVLFSISVDIYAWSEADLIARPGLCIRRDVAAWPSNGRLHHGGKSWWLREA